MNNIVDYGFREAYSSMKGMDKQKEIDPMIDWESLRPMTRKIFRNDNGKGDL